MLHRIPVEILINSINQRVHKKDKVTATYKKCRKTGKLIKKRKNSE